MSTNNSANYRPTQYNSIVGAATGGITNVAPSATTGIPLVSNGSSANPSFTTAVVAGGGTGATTLTLNGILYGNGTTAIGATPPGTTGQVLVATTSSAPTWNNTLSGPFTFSKANVAGNQIVEVKNTDNTNTGSFSTLRITVGGTSAGNPQINYLIAGGASWTEGIKTQSSGQYYLNSGSSDVMLATTGGNFTKPLNSCVFAYFNSGPSNVTGDGTTYNVAFTNTAFDTNSNFNTGTGVFTAPVTGRYLLTASLRTYGFSVSHTTFNTFISSSGNNYYLSSFYPYPILAGGTMTLSAGTYIAQMTAGDTAYVQLQVIGGSKDISISGALTNSNFCITLLG